MSEPKRQALMLDLPQSRSGMAGFINRYLQRLQACAVDDSNVANAFLRVTDLFDAPAALLRPAIA
ncbi:MAG: hypothetical protein ACT4QA_18960 [Panacagrimonas sp.]